MDYLFTCDVKPLKRYIPPRYRMRQYSTRWIEMTTARAYNLKVVKHHYAYVQHDPELLQEYKQKLLERSDATGQQPDINDEPQDLLEVSGRFFTLEDGREYFAWEARLRAVNRDSSFAGNEHEDWDPTRPFPDAACHCVAVYLPRAFKHCGNFSKVRANVG